MFLMLSSLLGMATPTPVIKKPIVPKQVVVWIHGTRISEKIINRMFQSIAEAEPNLSSSPVGLHSHHAMGPEIHIRNLGSLLQKMDGEKYSTEHFYSFGWSGDLSPKARKSTAQELCQSLNKLHDEYMNLYGCMPPLTLITHSHGGNVALNLADAECKPKFVVDKLVLLACPVQKYTAHHTASPLFKKIYSLHSDWDTFQVGDPQGLRHVRAGLVLPQRDRHRHLFRYRRGPAPRAARGERYRRRPREADPSPVDHGRVGKAVRRCGGLKCVIAATI